jgi:hypothetical protein
MQPKIVQKMSGTLFFVCLLTLRATQWHDVDRKVVLKFCLQCALDLDLSPLTFPIIIIFVHDDQKAQLGTVAIFAHLRQAGRFLFGGLTAERNFHNTCVIYYSFTPTHTRSILQSHVCFHFHRMSRITRLYNSFFLLLLLSKKQCHSS